MKNINLICIPFAGGNRYSYRQLFSDVPEWLQVHTIEPPGRGRRIKEPLLTDVDSLVDDLYIQVQPFLSTGYVLYGHSMGALLAFLLTRKIIRENALPPQNLFLSGYVAPSLERKEPEQHHLPKDEFLKMLKELGGIPDELFADEKLLDFYHPVIRADFKAIETYRYKQEAPIPVPVYVMAGDNEKISDEEMNGWAKETTLPLRCRRFRGGHFYIFNHARSIVDIIMNHANIPVV